MFDLESFTKHSPEMLMVPERFLFPQCIHEDQNLDRTPMIFFEDNGLKRKQKFQEIEDRMTTIVQGERGCIFEQKQRDGRRLDALYGHSDNFSRANLYVKLTSPDTSSYMEIRRGVDYHILHIGGYNRIIEHDAQ